MVEFLAAGEAHNLKATVSMVLNVHRNRDSLADSKFKCNRVH